MLAQSSFLHHGLRRWTRVGGFIWIKRREGTPRKGASETGACPLLALSGHLPLGLAGTKKPSGHLGIGPVETR